MLKTKLFVYGTLVHARTLAAVLGRKSNLPEYTPARLNDYRKVGLNIKEDVGDWVQGYVFEVDDADLARLDKYECVDDGMYRKIKVDVLVGKQYQEAFAYQMQ